MPRQQIRTDKMTKLVQKTLRNMFRKRNLYFTLFLLLLFICSIAYHRKIQELICCTVSFIIPEDQFYLTMLSEEIPQLSQIKQDTYRVPSSLSTDDELKNTQSDSSIKDDPSDYENSIPEIDYSYESTASSTDILRLLSAKPIAALTIAPTNPAGYTAFNSIYIKNETTYQIDIESSLNKAIDLGFSSEGPHVLIVHTHGTESYSQTGKSYYTSDDTDRSTDNSKNVIAVGDRIAEILNSNGIETVHITQAFDYPEYNNSYSRALSAISEQMKQTPSIKMVIDVHRDAMTSADGTKYKTVAQIDGKNAAQIMFVCGTNAGGLPHESWYKNLRLMIRLQDTLNNKYQNLMRPINLRKERFNQHTTNGSMIVEIGTSGNTLEEALYSAELFSNTLCEFLKDYL